MSFIGKVVIVTGASSGIGAAIAIKFAEEGAKVVIVGRNESKLKKVAEKCEQIGSKPLTIIADVSRDEDVKKMVSTTVAQLKKIDVLVNNAGIITKSAIYDDNAIEVFDAVMATNLRSVALATHFAASHLISSKGNIVNVSSIAALSVMTESYFSYYASKAALDHFSRAAALELASKGVRVNTVNPGPVKTDIFDNTGMDTVNQEQTWKKLEAKAALGRISVPEEIADLVLFIASDKAVAITGSTFVSDNGTLLNKDLDL